MQAVAADARAAGADIVLASPVREVCYRQRDRPRHRRPRSGPLQLSHRDQRRRASSAPRVARSLAGLGASTIPRAYYAKGALLRTGGAAPLSSSGVSGAFARWSRHPRGHRLGGRGAFQDQTRSGRRARLPLRREPTEHSIRRFAATIPTLPRRSTLARVRRRAGEARSRCTPASSILSCRARMSTASRASSISTGISIRPGADLLASPGGRGCPLGRVTGPGNPFFHVPIAACCPLEVPFPLASYPPHRLDRDEACKRFRGQPCWPWFWPPPVPVASGSSTREQDLPASGAGGQSWAGPRRHREAGSPP